jgi:hypothetical protein
VSSSFGAPSLRLHVEEDDASFTTTTIGGFTEGALDEHDRRRARLRVIERRGRVLHLFRDGTTPLASDCPG